MLDNSDFDYKTYIKEHSISEKKLELIIEEAIKENADIANDIKSGNLNKAGILVGKVLSKIGKAASGKVIRQKVISKLSGNETFEDDAHTQKNAKSRIIKEIRTFLVHF